MFKNNKQVSLSWEMSYKGNWNHKYPNLPYVSGKPIAIIDIGGDKLVWKHEEIFELIWAYFKADIEAIELILSGKNTGKIQGYETPFMVKLLGLIEELKGGIDKMQIGDFTEQQGNFLKAEAIKNNPDAVFEITGEAKIVKNNFDKNRVHVPIKLNGVDFILDCGKINARTIVEKAGSETKEWIGKKLKLEVYRTKTSEGKMVDAINIIEVI